MEKMTYIGKIVKRHVSNMVETDTGFNFPAGNGVAVGDFVITIKGTPKFIDAEEFPEIRKEIDKQAKEDAKNSPKKSTGGNDSAALAAAEVAVKTAEKKATKEKEEADKAKADLAAALKKLAALEAGQVK